MKSLIGVIIFSISFWVKAVPEIPDPNLNDIAIATHMNGQVVIVYNPKYCNKLGNLICNFFRAHEYGHVNLGHVIKSTHPSQAEFEADCWAAKNAPYKQVEAAYYHFMSQGFMGSWSHGTGIQRAQRIAACAGLNVNNGVAAACNTPYGSCRMGQRIPKGSSCYCPSPSGPVSGIAQ